MEEYRAVYKCRLCGEEFETARTGEVFAMTINTVLSVG